MYRAIPKSIEDYQGALKDYSKAIELDPKILGLIQIVLIQNLNLKITKVL